MADELSATQKKNRKRRAKAKEKKKVASQEGSDQTGPSSTSLDNERAVREGLDADKLYEIELAWCIYQIQLGLSRKNKDAYQASEGLKVYKKLTSATKLKPEKRHIMHVIFGDYRTLMLQEGAYSRYIETQGFVKAVQEEKQRNEDEDSKE